MVAVQFPKCSRALKSLFLETPTKSSVAPPVEPAGDDRREDELLIRVCYLEDRKVYLAECKELEILSAVSLISSG